MMRSRLPRSFSFALVLAACATACDSDPDTDATATDSDTEGDDASTGSPGTDTGGPSSTGDDGECTTLEQDDVAGDTTLPAGCYNVPFLLNLDGTLTLEAGAELHFDPLAGLFVITGGELAAQGSADAPVVFDASGADWMGIEFIGANSAGNVLDYAEISGTDGPAVVLGSSALSVTNSTISGSGGPGLAASDDSTLTVSASTLSGNTVPMELGLTHVEGIASDNDLTGNDEDVVLVRSGSVEDDTGWVDVGVPLRFDGALYIDAALSLAEGLDLEMAQDAPMQVSANGSLSAAGSESAPVVFRGVEDQPGYWQGISFESKASANLLSYAAVENAGSSQWNGNNITNAAVWLSEESKVVIENTAIRGSDGAAVMALDGADLSGFGGNTIENNAESLAFTPNMPAYLDGSNTFANNGDDVIQIYASFSEDAQLTDDTWPDAGLPYRVMERFDVLGDWVIDPGVTIEVSQDTSISITTEGSISAVGTAEAPIHIVGVEALQGFWQGIEIHSVSASNVFENVELLHAGSDGFNGSDDSDGSLFIGGFGGDGSVTVRDSTVGESGGYGIVVWTDSALLDCGSVTFMGNAKADVFVDPSGTSACQ